MNVTAARPGSTVRKAVLFRATIVLLGNIVGELVMRFAKTVPLGNINQKQVVFFVASATQGCMLILKALAYANNAVLDCTNKNLAGFHASNVQLGTILS